MANVFRKVRLLVWKNFILQIRRPVGTAIEILLPVAVVALLILARRAIKVKDVCFEATHGEVITDESNSFFNEAELKKNSTLAFWPINKHTQEILGQPSALNLSLILANVSRDSTPFKSKEQVIHEAQEYDEYVAAVTFDNIAEDANKALPKKIEYTIRMLHSRSGEKERNSWMTEWKYPFYMPLGARKGQIYDNLFPLLQLYVDSGIIRVQSGVDKLPVSKLRQFPYPDYRQDIFFLMIQTLLPLVFILAFMYSAITVVKELVAEKQARLKESMKMMGLSNWIHWLAWFIKNFIFFFITLILQLVFLKLGDIFSYAQGGVLFVFLLLYLTSTIFFLFFVSVFFSNAVRSMLFGGMIWFGTLAPYLAFASDEKFEATSTSAKAATCLLPNSCFGIVINLISRLETAQVGASFDNLSKRHTVDDNFTIAQALGMLILDCFLYAILTWYFENVYPGEYGVKKPLYFPFQPSYWCTAKPPVSGSTFSDARVPHTQDCEEEPTGLPVGVSISNLTKVYKSATGKKVAIDGLSLNMYKGQITCLLGHNGAGKTTTMSILTGLFPPSGGGARVGGHNIYTDMDAIRDSLGFCPQHNVLFDRLTVREHLDFFTALKGLSKHKADEEIPQMIEDIQLIEKADQKSCILSGGQKRKLSCAIALIGNSETVFLDEPTTGLDPSARRAIWELLQKYRLNKTIILTTHFMDEADHLGDRIAIMAEGKLKCCGSALFLKKRFGVGYHLTLVKGEEFDERKTISLFAEKIPTAKLNSNVGAEISYVLDEASSHQFKDLFETLEEKGSEFGIDSFGVSLTTLEEVFLKVSETANSEDMEEVNNGDTTPLDIPNSTVESTERNTGASLLLTQFYGIFVKRLLDSWRDRKAIITNVLVPLLLVFIGLLLGLSSDNSQTNDPAIKLDLNMLKADDNSIRALYYGAKMKDSASTTYDSSSVQLVDITSKVNTLYTGNQNNRVHLPYISSPYSANISNNMASCCNYRYLVLNQQCRDEISSDAFDDFICKDSEVFGYRGDCKNAIKPAKMRSCKEQRTPCVKGSLGGMEEYYAEYVLEDSGRERNDYFLSTVAGFHEENNETTVWYSNQGLHTIVAALNAGSNIVLKHLMNKDYSIATNNHPLPRNTQEKIMLAQANPEILVLVIFLSMATSSIAASFISFPVYERQTKAKHVQFVSGVNSVCYWLGLLCCDFVKYLVPGAGVLILIAAFNPTDLEGEMAAILLLVILFGMAVIPYIYLLSFLFTSYMVAYSVVSLLLTVLSMGMVITIFILNWTDKPLMRQLKLLFPLFPTYAFPQGIVDISSNKGVKTSCEASALSKLNCQRDGTEYVDNILSWDEPGIGYLCFYLFIEFIVYTLLVLLVEERFFLGGLLRSKTSDESPHRANEDTDVKSECDKVQSYGDKKIETQAVVVKNLTMVYRSTGVVAVDHLTFAIPQGECFGLLGVNGAGKTTTFGMLTGELTPSAGSAYVYGYNLTTQLRKAQQMIGYCPQFDALLERLTGREMLRLFSRLRGIPKHRIEHMISDVIVQLNLNAWADKMCGTYSGGNKRKLSTALALVGDPAIVFLDEPTSGMDPKSRRFLWNTLSQNLNEGKSIVLTSHSMEECEALCNRLVIMVNGRFKCIGGLQHLKSRFGEGYTIVIKVPTNPAEREAQTSKQEAVKSFMQKTFPCQLVDERQGLMQFKITSNEIKLSKIFALLEENKVKLQMTDYSVNQTSLEQVFVDFAKQQHTEERTTQPTCCRCSCF